MTGNYTYTQIANDYKLWLELIDIDGNMSRETFDATPVSELVRMMTDMFGAERITVSIAEDGIWATDAHLVRGKWQDGAAICADEDADDALYAMIADMVERGETDGRIEVDSSVYTWHIA